ncbi:hypothetical protein ACOME3_002469 [Neoechinorhynchus agilis]
MKSIFAFFTNMYVLCAWIRDMKRLVALHFLILTMLQVSKCADGTEGFVDFSVYLQADSEEDVRADEIRKNYNFLFAEKEPNLGYWHFRKMLNGPLDDVGDIIATTLHGQLNRSPLIKSVDRAEFVIRDYRKEIPD